MNKNIRQILALTAMLGLALGGLTLRVSAQAPTEEPKKDAPKPEEPKPDAPKPDAPKPEEPKPDAPKPQEPGK